MGKNKKNKQRKANKTQSHAKHSNAAQQSVSNRSAQGVKRPLQQQAQPKQPQTAASSQQAAQSRPNKAKQGLSALQESFMKKLEGARFRALNEKLYTTTGAEAFDEFSSDPSLFDVYHQGFRAQVDKWPVNPLDVIIDWIKKKHPTKVVGDFGCGDARLAASVSNQVYSFDLVAKNDTVTACDIAHVPLEDESIDIAVYCLALMGTNLVDYIREAYRVLKPHGILKIAEVRSRFEGLEDGMQQFKVTLKKLGFDLVKYDSSNRMFYMLELRKSNRPPQDDVAFTAKACVYKKR